KCRSGGSSAITDCPFSQNRKYDHDRRLSSAATPAGRPGRAAFLQAASPALPGSEAFDRRTTDSILEDPPFAEQPETRDFRRRARARSLRIATPPKPGGAFMDSGMTKGPAALVLGLTLARARLRTAVVRRELWPTVTSCSPSCGCCRPLVAVGASYGLSSPGP